MWIIRKIISNYKKKHRVENLDYFDNATDVQKSSADTFGISILQSEETKKYMQSIDLKYDGCDRIGSHEW